MRPRLKSSKKWTPFPKEYTEQIQKVFRENFAAPLANGILLVEGRIYAQEIALRVGVVQKGELKQSNFEISMDYSPEKQDAIERIHDCIDSAASMMADYFENDGEIDFPRTWKPFPFQDQTVYLQYTTENTELEAAANRLLGESDVGLVREEQEGEDALEHAEIDEDISGGKGLDGVEEEDPEDPGSPRMFGGKPRKKSDMH